MNRSLAAALGLGLAATLAGGALAQSPWPAAPSQPAAPATAPAPAQASPWPSSPSAPAPNAAPWPSSPQQSSFPSGGGAPFGAPPQQAMSPICTQFPSLRDEAQKKASVVQAVGAHKPPDRAKMCGAVTAFYGAEQKVVVFLETNKTKCNVPDQAVQQAKLIHANTEKFKDQVCAEGPKPKIPTLSDAISTTPVDTPKNTKTGPGTFNTLTGNPLGN